MNWNVLIIVRWELGQVSEEETKVGSWSLVLSWKGKTLDMCPVRLDNLNPFFLLLSPPPTKLGFWTWDSKVSHSLGSAGSHNTRSWCSLVAVFADLFVAPSVTGWNQLSLFSWLISALRTGPTSWWVTILIHEAWSTPGPFCSQNQCRRWESKSFPFWVNCLKQGAWKSSENPSLKFGNWLLFCVLGMWAEQGPLVCRHSRDRLRFEEAWGDWQWVCQVHGKFWPRCSTVVSAVTYSLEHSWARPWNKHAAQKATWQLWNRGGTGIICDLGVNRRPLFSSYPKILKRILLDLLMNLGEQACF